MRTRLPVNVTRERSRHGTVVYYYRVGKGPRTRLPAFGSPEFPDAYLAAARGEPVPIRTAAARAGTLRWLVIEYKKSLHFRSLDEITQRRRDAMFKQMVDKSGEVAIGRITEKVIVDAREKRTGSGKGTAANNFIKAIRPLFAYAKQRGWIDTDPARAVDYVSTEKGEQTPWTVDDVQKYEARHPLGTMANLAMRILLFTGLRRSDAILLGRQHIRNGQVRFRPAKTTKSSGITVSFTALRPLLEAIEATRTGDLTFLVTEHGRPFASGAAFGNKFADWCNQAKVSARAHGLRKIGPTLAAEFGASPHELMAMWGWVTLEHAELYTRSVDRERLGNAAASRLGAAYDELIANNIPRTSEPGAGTERKAK